MHHEIKEQKTARILLGVSPEKHSQSIKCHRYIGRTQLVHRCSCEKVQTSCIQLKI